MRLFLITILLASAICSAQAEVYRVIENGTVQEYSVDVSTKSKTDIQDAIRTARFSIDDLNVRINSIVSEKEGVLENIAGLEAILAELIANEEAVDDQVNWDDTDLLGGAGVNF